MSSDARLFPVMLRLEGRRVVVVGGGEVATRKVRALLDAGAQVEVIAPEVSGELQSRNGLTILVQPFEPQLVDGATLVFAATNVPEVNAAVAAAARDRGIPVNVADDPESCDFFLPAIARQGELDVFLSSHGASPLLTRRARERVQAVLGPEYDVAARLLRMFRPLVRDNIAEESKRRQFFEAISSDAVLEHARTDDRTALQADVAAACTRFGVPLPEEVRRFLQGRS